MPSNPNLFAEAIASPNVFDIPNKPYVYHGILQNDPMELINKLIPNIIDANVHHLRNSGDLLPNKPFPDVIAGLIDDKKVNACAFKYRGHYFIGINTGVIAMIFELFRRLLSMPDVMPWVGKSAAESLPTDLPPIKRDGFDLLIHSPDIDYYENNLYPQDPDRMKAAMALSGWSCNAIIAHEFRHIHAGHLEYVESWSGLPFVSEFSSSGGLSEEKALKYQALELDADNFASMKIISNIYGDKMIASTGSLRPTFAPEAHHAIHAALVCLDVVFKIFDDTPPNPITWLSYRHPPDFLRRIMMSDAVLAFLHHQGPEHVREWESKNHIKPLHDVTEVKLGSMLGETSRVNPWRAFEQEGKEHVTKIRQMRERIRPALSQHSYVRLGTFL